VDLIRRRALAAAAGVIGLLPLQRVRAGTDGTREAPPRADASPGAVADDRLRDDLRQFAGADNVGFSQDSAAAKTRTALAKLREWISVLDFGADPTGNADSTDAIHLAMKHLMDRFGGTDEFYPRGPGDPSSKGLNDFMRRDRRTGRIYFPAGIYKVQPEVFSSLDHARAPYVGFEFFGEHRFSSILVLETHGAEAWFYRTGAALERYQAMTFRSLGFTADDYRYGSFAKVYSSGGPKQFTVELCEFRNINQYMETQGSGNADLMRTVWSTVEHYGAMLTLDNGQSVQHDFIGTHFRSWGSQVRVKRHGGGNVSIKNSSIDLIWDERVSPSQGNFLFEHEADANIGQGNCTYKWEDCRVEVEAYKTTAGDPPFGLIKTVEDPIAFPRIILDNVNFVNGQTYSIDRSGSVTDAEYRRITAMRLWPGKHVEVRGGVILKTFFYRFDGGHDGSSPGGGIVHISRALDGIRHELPATDKSLENIHDRVHYAGSAGRLITDGMEQETTGSSFIRKLLDADPRWRSSFGSEPAATKKLCHFKHIGNSLPSGVNARNDHVLDLPANLMALRLFVKKEAAGSDTNSYQLHLRANDRSGRVIGSSALAQFKDEHVIDLDHVDLSGVKRICLCASGTWNASEIGGIAYIEYV